MNIIRARVSEAGRISLPATVRRAVGLERGGDVVIDLDGKEIRIRTVDEVVARAQALTRQLLGGKSGSTVESFLTERQREAEREG